MADLQIQYCATADGVSIAYYAIGDGPALVIASTIWWSHLRMTNVPEHHRSGAGIGRGRRVVRYDARGTGLSSRDTLDFSIESRVTDLECVVDHLGIERFALFASAHGCPAAIAYAAAHPERVSHLVLWRPFARGKDTIRNLERFASLRNAGDWDIYTTTIANLNTDFKDSALAERMARRMRESMTFESCQTLLDQTMKIDVSDLLPRIHTPTLVGWSEGISIPLEITKAVAAGIPGARLFTYRRGAGQWSDQATLTIEEFLGDASAPSRRGSGPDRSVQTILFTDITDSTALTQRLGDAKAQELVRAHNSIVREALKAHGGREIKHTGDGIMASFPSASGAIECAVAMQRAVQALADEHLSVHIGINAGEPVAEDADLFGTSVQLARRICDHAGAGQIFVSNVVRELSAGKSFLFADSGDIVLKGFEDPVRLYEVRWRDG